MNSTHDCEISNGAAATALQSLPSGVEPGTRVDLRGSRWLLERTVPRDDCCELHVVDAAGQRRILLWPFDRPSAIARPPSFTAVRMRAWCRAIAAAAGSQRTPHTPRAGRVRADVMPYQLEPALAIAAGETRIVLADEVGLGKTVQAGWIVADLLERDRDARILIAVPAGLRRQWRSELDTLFSVHAVIVDAAWMRAAIADVPADVSPWSGPGVYLGSIDFFKRPDVAASLPSHTWDLLIVDEAHGAAAPTDRHGVLAAVAARARRIVSITATPFSGDTSAFSSVAALGATADGDPPIMFRRSREDIGDGRRRRHRFAPVRISRPEFRLQRLLERYCRDVWREAIGDVDGARLAVTILRKRALSSPAAAERSLRRRLALLQGAAAAPRQLSFFDDDDEADDDLADAALATPGFADAAREERWLAMLVAAAGAAAPYDSKLRRLRRLRERLRGEAAIVFTEYRDTLRHLAAGMPRALQMHGGMSAAERAGVQGRFNEDGGWLLATDAASEGLNLQQRCRLVVNYELPWNPARLEQRIGRVDRIGQRRPVHAVTLVARDTAEDLVVANLTRRLTRVAAALGDRDRLAAFLNDARVARSVIGAEPLAIEPAADRVDRVTAPAPDLCADAALAAYEIRRRLAAPPLASGTVVSSLRVPRGLASGWVIAVRAVAQTPDGDVAAERLVLLHAAGAPRRPASADEARRSAAIAVEAVLPRLAGSVPDFESWRREVEHAHGRTVTAQIARETALRDRRVDRAPVQRGLFDRRAVAAADRRDEYERAAFAEHSDRIRRLESERRLRTAAIPAAVLILWR